MDLAHDLTHAWTIHNGQGVDISLKLAPYLVSIAAHDAPGRISDEVTLVFDAGKTLLTPKLSQKLRIFMGESKRSMVDLGDYYASDYSLSGPPDAMEVLLRPIYFGGGADPADWEAPSRAAETRHTTHEFTTIGKIGQQVAGALGVAPAVDPDFAAYAFDYVEQRGETDMEFLARLAAEAGGVAKVSAGKLIVGTLHTSQSYGRGADMPSVTITPDDVSGYGVDWSARDTPGRFRARWYDPSTAGSGEVTFGSAEPVIDMLRQFPSKLQAERAVNAAFNLRGRERRRATLSLSSLNMKLWVGSEVKLGRRWHEEIRGRWAVVEAMHQITASGGATSVAIELK